MARHAIIILVLFCFSLSFSMAAAQSAKPNIATPPNHSPEKLNSTQKIDPSWSKHKGLSESEAYQLLYVNSREANATILTTLHFSFGIVATIILAIVGSQIFFNYRLNKQEIKKIRGDIDNHIALLSEKLENIKDRSKTIETTMNSKLEERAKLVDAQFDLNKKDNEAFKNSVNMDVKNLKIDLEEAAGHIWMLKDVPSNALSSFVKSTSLQIEAGKLSLVEYSLRYIINALDDLKELHVLDYEALEKLVKVIPKENEGQKQKIIELFKLKPTYEYLDTVDPATGLSLKKYVKNAPVLAS